MKKLIFGLGILVTGLTSMIASANDYCASPCNACLYGTGFEGLYLGGNLGAITQFAFRNEEFDGAVEGKTHIYTDFTAGGQLGYDWNPCWGLFGLVVDWNWSNLQKTFTTIRGDQLKEALDWYLTIRGRIGMTARNCLFYLSAGAVLSRFETLWDAVSTAGVPIGHFHKNESQWGWTGGFGFEYLVGCNLGLGLDILYMHFNSKEKKFNGGTDALTTSNSVFVGRVLLNYHFGNIDLFCW